ncbi:MAG TPA: SMC-Scp complex subunit ScpB [Candidatus Nanoarchaeia archaeon]|nr:SMC-Scp complex subunit ScpB [Candidatus Nanoarchaeia archaeon]
MNDKNKIEAILFTTGKFMSLEEIGKVSGIGSDGIVKELVEELKKSYDDSQSALYIQENEGKYKLNIRKEYGHLANQLVSSTEMDSPTTKTLAVIAWKNPALQSDVIKIRGNKAYDHINMIKEQGLVTAEKYGRTRLLKLTPRFFDYFDTAEPQVKEMLQKEVEKAKGAASNKDYSRIREMLLTGLNNVITNNDKQLLLVVLEKVKADVKDDIGVPASINNALYYLLETENNEARALHMTEDDFKEIIQKMKEGEEEELEMEIEKEAEQVAEVSEDLKSSETTKG